MTLDEGNERDRGPFPAFHDISGSENPGAALRIS